MRDDPTGKRALFEAHPGTTTVPEGKPALFEGGGGVAIECSRCGRTSRVGFTDAVRRILGLSLWVPGRTHSRHLRCPACGQRSWVRLSLD